MTLDDICMSLASALFISIGVDSNRTALQDAAEVFKHQIRAAYEQEGSPYGVGDERLVEYVQDGHISFEGLGEDNGQ